MGSRVETRRISSYTGQLRSACTHPPPPQVHSVSTAGMRMGYDGALHFASVHTALCPAFTNLTGLPQLWQNVV
jgi:hypothetical protein